jgi:hypothetical protein
MAVYLDSLYALVCEACDFNIGAQSDCLWRKTALNVLDKFFLYDLRRPFDTLEHLLRVAVYSRVSASARASIVGRDGTQYLIDFLSAS